MTHAAAFQLHTRKHPALRAKVASPAREVHRDIVAQLLRLFPEEELPLPAGKLVKILGALGEGLLAAYFLDPEEFPESLFVDAFEAMSPQ